MVGDRGGFEGVETFYWRDYLKQRIVNLLRKNISSEIRAGLVHSVKMILSRRYRRHRKEMNRLLNLPRLKAGATELLGPKLEYVDAFSCAYTYDFIFEDDVYSFAADDEKSCLILDCGANIGLSAIYFKRQHPQSTVIAFEADPKIYKVLESNIKRFKLKGVELHDQAVWIDNGGVTFDSTGTDDGHIDSGAKSGISVKSVRLRDYLDRDIDLLKLDIEGAETNVLRDCADSLDRVKRIFVEYHSYARQAQTLPEILDILAKAGFRYHIGFEGEQIKSAFRMTWPDSGQDMRLNIFAVRV